ncbi:hypothetical protein BDN71DRAFT_1490935 [Pleurotus eryngii]|uniref:C2H2-type domain-containing protein n=1 Tax=Pleurotus eryngii TaxID=5323 RepID=A0A9P6DBC4_PLEER|nr:hypothetical protein BDN71DRAFT_1490935 [Pleurotus eryngii]
MPMVRRRRLTPAQLPCGAANCRKRCRTLGGLKRHRNSCHKWSQHEMCPLLSPSSQTSPVHERAAGVELQYHPLLDGTPCDIAGNNLAKGESPPLPPTTDTDDFGPFVSQGDFEFTEFLYRDVEMSGGHLDQLAQLLATLYPDQDPPFVDHDDLYATIDSIEQGEIRWKSFSITYNGQVPESNPPSWMSAPYEVWYRDPLSVLEQQLANPDFNGEIDYAPKLVYKDGKRQYTDFMSGDWAWCEANKIAEDNKTCDGAMLIPIILGSDKTTVSVATGNNEFYPLYGGIGNVHNNVRRAHRNAVSLIALLAIPKTSREYQNDVHFRKFRRQLFHTSLHHILCSLRPHMTRPRVSKCPDGHFRRGIYSFGAYIADYPEQVLLACTVSGWCPKCTALNDELDIPGGQRCCEHTTALQEACTLREAWDNYGVVGDLIPFTSAFPRADIHEMLSMDLLHQVIKGTYKDHLVEWVVDYINAKNLPADAARILADIDQRIAAAPPFPGLRRFPEGRNFKQWTGDDSKALMKVFLPAIAGRVPNEMVATIRSFTEFCYLVRRSIIPEDTLTSIELTLNEFNENRQAFKDLGVRTDFNLPRQHAVFHYPQLIRKFGAPNGLCSSITENKHIKAIKKPWRRSNKLAAARVYFESHGMLGKVHRPSKRIVADADDALGPLDQGAAEGVILAETRLAKTRIRNYPRHIEELGLHIGFPELALYIQEFLHDQINDMNSSDTPPQLPHVPKDTKVNVYHSGVSTFYAPSDLSGTGGMHHERVRATPKWHDDPGGRYDCVFLSNESDSETSFRGLHVARLQLLFSFKWNGETYPCALIHWFSAISDAPDPLTGLWIVKPDTHSDGHSVTAVVHLDTILRGAHLIGVAGSSFLPDGFHFSHTFNAFSHFYVNKYADHHAHEVAF